MPKSEHPVKYNQLLAQFREHNPDLAEIPAWMFKGTVVYFDKNEETVDQLDDDAGTERVHVYDLDTKLAGQIVHFAGGTLADGLDDAEITHVVVDGNVDRLREIRGRNSL